MCEDYQVVAPVGPLVTSTTLMIGVAQAVLVEQFPELGIVLIEEILLADAQPIDLGALLELGDELGLQVVIDGALALIHAADSGREQTHIGKVIGLVSTDV